jgi:hypothetical protein
VQAQLTTLQQLLEAARITPEHRSDEGPSTSPTGEVGATNSYFSQMETGHRVLKISPDVIEFPTPRCRRRYND